MNQDNFELRHKEEWSNFETWIATVQKRNGSQNDDIHNVPHLYRKICHHLAMAKSRMYSPHLILKLNRLVLDGHAIIYKSRAGIASNISQFLVLDFPKAIRQEKMYVLLSSILFFGTFFAVAIIIQFYPDFALSVLGAEQISTMEKMYDPGSAHYGMRESGSHFKMFGYYIFNNITIGFRIFAGGMLLGTGAAFYLLLNGFMIGAVIGHLVKIGYAATILPFIAGHGSFELIAFVLAGAAGFKIGYSFINPGRLKRVESIRKAGTQCGTILWGVFLMLLIAAFIEAYWSPLQFTATTKYTVGLVLWVLVISYFVFMGRRRAV